MAGQWLKYVLQIVSLVVLARLLDPTDFGLFTMVMAVAGIALVIGDSGLSLAAVQVSTLSQKQKSALFWINTAVGSACALLLFIGAPLIASFYGEPRLIDLCRAMTVTFVFYGMAIQFRVELNRSWRFKSLALVDVIAQLGALIAAVLFALFGAGAFALVVQQVAAAFITLICAAVLAKWVPSWPSRGAHIGGLLKAGGVTLATQMVTYTSANVDSIAIGRASGAEALGIYSRAFQVFMIPLQQLATPMTRVALPVLSAITDEAVYSVYLRKAQVILAYVLVGALSFLAAAAAPVLDVVLGSEWSAGAPLLQLLAIGGCFQAMGYIYYWICLSRARMSVLFWCELAGRVLMIVLIFAVAGNGPEWVAAAHSVGLAAVWVGSAFFGMRALGLRSWPVIAVALRPLAIWVVAFFASTALLRSAVGDMLPILQIFVVAAVFLVVIGLAAAVPAVRRDLRGIFDVGVKIFKR